MFSSETYVDWDPMANNLPIKLVSNSSQVFNKTTWEECTEVVKSLYIGLILNNTRHFFTWDRDVVTLLHKTQQYSDSTYTEDLALESQWKELISKYLRLGGEMDGFVA